MEMKKIPFTQFIQQICENESAKICSKTIKSDNFIPNRAFVENEERNCSEVTYRKVVKKQTNAICFENESWLYFKPLNKHTTRKAYQFDTASARYLMLVDTRESYVNAFGTPISALTMVLLYKLKINDTNG